MPSRFLPPHFSDVRAFTDITLFWVKDWAWCALLGVGLGCGEPQSTRITIAPQAAGNAGTGALGSSGGGGGPGAGAESRSWTWSACGTIPSHTVDSLLPEYEVGQAIEGGHPYSTGLGDISRMTALAMSADGLTLVSMGGVTLVWSVAPLFANSRAVFLDSARPERPRLSVSPDGRWIVVSGDGWRVLSREGADGPYLSFPRPDTCWPAGVVFSQGGDWLAGTGFGPGIGVFRAADLQAPSETEIEPFVSLEAPCGPARFESLYATTTRVAFTPDGGTLITETGASYRTSDWQLVDQGQGLPEPHGLHGDLTVSAEGTRVLSDCTYSDASERHVCSPYPGRFAVFSSEGSWLLAGGTLTHVASGDVRVLDASAPVGIFAPNGDVIVAAQDNALTRYCRSL